MPATCGKWAPHCRQSMRSFHHSPTRTPWARDDHIPLECKSPEKCISQPCNDTVYCLLDICRFKCMMPRARPGREFFLSLTVPRGSCSGGMGPKWSGGTVTMMRPLAALARPDRTCQCSDWRDAAHGLTLDMLAVAAAPRWTSGADI